jgi:hypothetical protein
MLIPLNTVMTVQRNSIAVSAGARIVRVIDG